MGVTESTRFRQPAWAARFRAVFAAGMFIDRALRTASDLVAPPTPGPARIRIDAWFIYVCVVVGLALAMKFVVILGGAVTMTNSDGASRLFVAIDRFGDPAYFRELSTWLGQPMPVPQIYYTLLYAVDRLTGGAAPVTVAALLMNSLFYAAAVLTLALVARRVGGAPAGAIFALLAVTAHMPNFISMTAAVEPPAIMFFSAGLWLCVGALTASRPFLYAVWAAPRSRWPPPSDSNISWSIRFSPSCCTPNSASPDVRSSPARRSVMLSYTRPEARRLGT